MIIALGGVFYYLLSFLGHGNYWINAAVFVVICLAALFLAIKKFELAVGLAFLELILSSFGRMFYLDIFGAQITLRMALFLIIIGVWVIRQLQAKSYKLQAKIYYLPFFAAVLWGVARGFINGNSFDNVFADANAFLFFAYLGPAIEVFKKVGWGRVKQVLAGGIIALWVVTMFSSVGFSYGLFEIGDGFYKWIRDSRLGEVTFVNDQFSRVFFQSHIFALLGIFLFASKQYLILGVLAASIIWADLSRSFWVGGITGIILYASLKLVSKSHDLETKRLALMPVLIVIAGFVLSAILLPALPQVAFGRGASTTDPASNSRKAMLSPLSKGILKNPILGSGFGTKVTYKTSDPRVLQMDPSGEVATYAFEWGWLDLWVKVGFLGVLAYIGLILAILRRLYRRFRLTNDSIYLGAAAGLLALAATHTFSPYLNHPLGIGIILLADSLAE